MAFNKGLIKTPVEPCATPPAGNKGSGGGVYDGLDGFKKRTGGDGPPEKVMEDVGSLPKAPNLRSPLGD